MQNNDLICRSALIEAFKNFFDAPIRKNPQEQYTLDCILAVVNDAESVQLPNGKWVLEKDRHKFFWVFTCNLCGYS